MSTPNITAINVFIEVDGKQCIAVIDHQMKDIFLGMLPAYQGRPGPNASINLATLPPAASEHLIECRRAILEHIKR